ncbi:MAG: YcbK family protein [Oxalobacteraceae bacterium]
MRKFNQKLPFLINPPVQGRRRFLKIGGVALAASFAGTAIAAVPTTATPERRLRLYNIHTGEQSTPIYWADGAYQDEGLAQIDRLLRDYRSDEVSRIDTGLLDLLNTLSASLDTQESLHVISGYRSPATNAMLRERSGGVAKHSLHMDGLAIDIRVPGRNLSDVRRAAIALNGGGVGYYPDSDFVHVDVGRVRIW